MIKSQEKIFLSMIYISSIMLFLNFSSTMIIWILMEVNMVVFILIMKNNKDKEGEIKPQELLYYFMIQTLGSIMFLTGMATQENLYLEPKNIIIMALTLKMGLFPLEKWIFKISKNLENNSFITLMTMQKVPMLLILSQMESMMIMTILTVNLIMGAILITKSKSVKDLIISSSIYSTLWMFIPLIKSLMSFIILFSKYSLTTFLLLSNSTLNNSKMKMIFMLMSSMFLLGLPPFEMFFMKIFILSDLSSSVQIMMSVVMWLATFIATFGYFKLLSFNMMKKEALNLIKSNKMSTKKSIAVSSFLSVMMFI